MPPRKLAGRYDLVNNMVNNAVTVTGFVETKEMRAKRQASTRKHILKSWQLYAMLLLPVAYVLLFSYYPMYGLLIAFKDYTPKLGIFGSEWVGLKHFVSFLNGQMFWTLFRNTLIVSIYSLLCSFPLSVILALALNVVRVEKFKKVVQTVTYIPHFFSVVIVVGMMFQIFSPHIGIFKHLVVMLQGEGAAIPDIMGNANAFYHTYVWSTVWQNLGFNSIIYIAALSSVDTELYESAQIDGASRFKILLNIDIPTILPTIIIMLILRSGTILTVGYEKALLMQNTANIKYSELISTYVYNEGVVKGFKQYSSTTAINMFNSIINFICIWSVNKFSQKVGESSLW